MKTIPPKSSLSLITTRLRTQATITALSALLSITASAQTAPESIVTTNIVTSHGTVEGSNDSNQAGPMFGQGITINVGADINDCDIPQTVFLQEVSFQASSSGFNASTKPVAYLHVYDNFGTDGTTAPSVVGNLIAVSTNALDFSTVSPLDTLTWQFAGNTLDKSTRYHYVIAVGTTAATAGSSADLNPTAFELQIGNPYLGGQAWAANRFSSAAADWDFEFKVVTSGVDTTAPIVTPPSDVLLVAFGSEPAVATTMAEFLAQGGTIDNDCDLNAAVSSDDVASGFCPTVITRTYTVTDAAGNAGSCAQTITVNNLFAEDAILWHQPLARKGMSDDTDPGAGGTLKYGFKLGKTIPIKIHALSCTGNVTGNSNVTGTVVVYGDTNMDGVADGNAIPIDYNGVGGAGGAMDLIDGHLRYNLDTKTLKAIANTKCYLLEVTITDSSTGEVASEIIPLQAK